MLKYQEKWLELPTKLTIENATHYQYTSITTSSIFAIIAKLETPINIAIRVKPSEVNINEK